MQISTKTIALSVGGFALTAGLGVFVALNFDTIKNGIGSTIRDTVDTTVSAVTSLENVDLSNEEGLSDDGSERLSEDLPDDGESSLGEIASGSVDGTQSGYFRDEDTMRIYTSPTTGNAVLIKSGKDTMLIDTGDASDGAAVVKLLAENGVSSLKYLVISNYHKESVGSFAYIVENYDVGYILLADTIKSHPETQHLIPYLNGKELLWVEPRNSTSYVLGTGSFTLITEPIGGSIITQINQGNTSMVITGSTALFDDSILFHLPSKTDLMVVTQPSDKYIVPRNVLDRVKPSAIVYNDSGIKSQTNLKVLLESGATLYQSSTAGNIHIGSNSEDLNVILNAK